MDIDAQKSDLEAKFNDLATKVAQSQGLELYDLEYQTGKALLIVYIMNPETKSAVIEDCVKVDRAFDEYLDEEWVPEFTLEVSSPGMFRKMKTRPHFEMSLNEMIKVVTKQPVIIDEAKSKSSSGLRGILKSVLENGIEIEQNEKIVKIDFENIKKANLDPEF